MSDCQKKNVYVPRETTVCNTRDIFSTLFGFHENITIIRSYVAENKKSVIILSIIPHDKATGDPQQKRKMVVFSKAKFRTDVMDKITCTLHIDKTSG